MVRWGGGRGVGWGGVGVWSTPARGGWGAGPGAAGTGNGGGRNNAAHAAAAPTSAPPLTSRKAPFLMTRRSSISFSLALQRRPVGAWLGDVSGCRRRARQT